MVDTVTSKWSVSHWLFGLVVAAVQKTLVVAEPVLSRSSVQIQQNRKQMQVFIKHNLQLKHYSNRNQTLFYLDRDERSYTLSHMYDQFLATSHHYRGKNRKKWLNILLMKVSGTDRNVKGK